MHQISFICTKSNDTQCIKTMLCFFVQNTTIPKFFNQSLHSSCKPQPIHSSTSQITETITHMHADINTALIPLEGDSEHSHALFPYAAEVRLTKETSGRTTAAGEPWTSPWTCGMGSLWSLHAIMHVTGFNYFMLSYIHALYRKWKGDEQLTCFFSSGQQPTCCSGGPHAGVMIRFRFVGM